VHVASVEPYLGGGAHGPVFGAAVSLDCYVEDKRQLVRSDTGEEVVSNTTIHCPVDTTIPPGSRVTVFGRATTVLTVARFDTAGRSRLDHLEVALA